MKLQSVTNTYYYTHRKMSNIFVISAIVFLTIKRRYDNIINTEFLSMRASKMYNNNNSSQENAFDLREYIYVLLDKWYIAAILCFVSVFLSFTVTKFFISSKYTSTAKIYIMNNETQTFNSQDISVSSYLAKDYEEFIVDRSVLEVVIDELNLNCSYESLKSSIGIKNPENTRIIEISVVTGNAEQSKRIADCVCKVSIDKITELMGVDRAKVFRDGNLPKGPSSPVMSKNLLVGFLIGLAASLAVVFVYYFVDDKIKGPKDVEKYLGISLLGVIPYNKQRNRSKTADRTRRHNAVR